MDIYSARRAACTLFEGASLFGFVALLTWVGSEEAGNLLCHLIETWTTH